MQISIKLAATRLLYGCKVKVPDREGNGLCENIFMISDIASATGLSRHTLNFYFNIGLIEESRRTVNNYRFFDDSVVDRLKEIISLRAKGHSVHDFKTLLEDGRP